MHLKLYSNLRNDDIGFINIESNLSRASSQEKLKRFLILGISGIILGLVLDAFV
jgi:hypothetical protein